MMRAALLALIALAIAGNSPAIGAFDATMEFPTVRNGKRIIKNINKHRHIRGNSHPRRIGRTLEARRITGERNGMVTIKIATGGQITVAPSFAPKITAFIAELCGVRGYCPKRINCYDYAGHVSNSQHYRGTGCDFEQTGWNKTGKPMYHLGGLAAKHGLRDGCSFRDCGHIDAGGHNKRKHHSNRHRRHR